MIEKKPEPICIYDQEKMIVGAPDKRPDGKMISNVYCRVCTNRVFIRADKLVCPVCFSNLLVGNGDCLCSNPDCSSYDVKEFTIKNDIETEKTLTVKWTPEDVQVARFRVCEDEGLVKSGQLWLAPAVITYIAVNVLEKYFADNNLKLKIAKPGGMCKQHSA